MAVDIGPKIGIDGESEFRKGIQQINQSLKTLQSEMKAVTSEFGTNASAQDKLAAQNETLTKTIQKQEEKLAALQDGLAKSAEKYGEESTQTLKWQQAVNEATAALNKSKNQLDDNNRALEEMGDETNNVAKATEDLGEAQDRIGTLGKAMLATLTAAAVAAGKVITDIVKSSLDAVGNYEQLVGGVETLFGDSAVKVLRNAADAYKTAGLSANDYMETVTSFSASLLQGLGGDTEKAADLANQALIDMADNANKMGTDMSSVMAAYQGFAKQNWTLLDNLKLGYGGSATQMLRLINRANELDSTILGVGQSVKKIDEVSFDQIIRAIHVVQDELGITGTTAKEASTTIQGSMQAAKAAWDNFLSGAGDATAFTEAFGTALDNVIDNLKVIIPRVVEGLTQMADKIMPLIPGIINDFLPVVIKGISSLIKGVIKELPSLLKTIGKALAENIDSVLAIAWIPIAAFNTKITDGFNKFKGVFQGGIKGIGNSISGWLSSPGGLLAIAGAFATMVSLIKQSWQNSPLGQIVQQTKDATDNWNDFLAAQQDSADKGLAEINYIQDLKTELDGLIDANGKVKEGYEARAQFITSELTEATGIELELIDGVIQGYDNLSASIEDALKAQRIDTILESEKAAFDEAIPAIEESQKRLQDIIKAMGQEMATYLTSHIQTTKMQAGAHIGLLQDTAAQEKALLDEQIMARDKYESDYELALTDEEAFLAQHGQIMQTELQAQGDANAAALTEGGQKMAAAGVDAVNDTSAQMQEATKTAGFERVGEYAAEGFANGMGTYTALQKIAKAAIALALHAKSKLMQGLDENSPSKVMMEIGEYATEGFAIGLTNGLSSVRAAMTKTVNTVQEGMAGAVPTPQPTTASLVAGAVNGMASAAPTAGGGMLTVNLVMPDGKKLAQSTIKDFINVARANGTPITAY